MRLADGSEAEFLLPVHDAAEDKRQRKRESQKQDTERTLKLSGLQKVLDVRAKRESTLLVNGSAKGKEDVVNYIRCEVLPEQPTIRIRGTSLTHGAMMLYAGEKCVPKTILSSVSLLTVRTSSVQDENTDHPRERRTSAHRLRQPLLSRLNNRSHRDGAVGRRSLGGRGIRTRVGSGAPARLYMEAFDGEAAHPSKRTAHYLRHVLRQGWLVSLLYGF